MEIVLLRALGIFGLSLIAHILVWRVDARRNQGIWLGVVFFLMPACIGGGVAAWKGTRGFGLEGEWAGWALAYLLHGALSVAYMFLYTAVSGVSPSIAILEKVDESMPRGLRRHELAPKWFSDLSLSGIRRDNLVRSGFVSSEGGVLRLKARGRLIAICFVVFRRLLGLSDIAKG